MTYTRTSSWRYDLRQKGPLKEDLRQEGPLKEWLTPKGALEEMTYARSAPWRNDLRQKCETDVIVLLSPEISFPREGEFRISFTILDP